MKRSQENVLETGTENNLFHYIILYFTAPIKCHTFVQAVLVVHIQQIRIDKLITIYIISKCAWRFLHLNLFVSVYYKMNDSYHKNNVWDKITT